MNSIQDWTVPFFNCVSVDQHKQLPCNWLTRKKCYFISKKSLKGTKIPKFLVFVRYILTLEIVKHIIQHIFVSCNWLCHAQYCVQACYECYTCSTFSNRHDEVLLCFAYVDIFSDVHYHGSHAISSLYFCF